MIRGSPLAIDQCIEPVFHCRLVPDLTLPDYENPPAEPLQSRFLTRIPDNVGSELRGPKGSPRLGRGGVSTTFVSMPEAAVNENGQTVFREHQVGTTGKVLTVKSKS